MVDINVLYSKYKPNGFQDTLNLINESKSTVNLFIDYFINKENPDVNNASEKTVKVDEEFERFSKAINNVRNMKNFK